MATKLAGKIALVTGGSSGLGLATAKRFIDEGARVIVTGRRQAELDLAVIELGSNALGVVADVSKLSDLDRLYATIRERYERLESSLPTQAVVPSCRWARLLRSISTSTLGLM